MDKVFYWANVFNGLETALIVFIVLFAVILAVWMGFFLSEATNYSPDEELLDKYKRGVLWISAVLVFLGLGIVFIPDRQTYLLMKGSQAVEEMYKNNKTLQEIPENTVTLINEYVKTLTKELQEDESSE